MQYFVRTMEKHKKSSGAFSSELPCYGLAAAKAEAKRLVLSANPALQLQSDAIHRLSFPISTMRGAGASNRSFESGEDVFVHFSAIEATGYYTLEGAARVSFVVKTVPQGTSGRTSHLGVRRER